jgi:uncharacterized repeat protein (TIGR01451 family)
MKLFNKLPVKVMAVVAGFAAAAGIATVAIAGFGPDRPTKDWNVDKTGFNYVTYNSFVNIEGKGDERDFLEGVQVGRDGEWQDPINNVEAGEVEVKLYMHNNASPSLNTAPGTPGIATNVKARVELPTGKSQVKDLRATIEASNANPVSIFDTLTLAGANGGEFEIVPVLGSGKLIENGQVIDTVDVAQLIAGGVNLPNQNGCSEYVREITFRIKTKVASWTLEKEVSKYNQGQYAKSVNAVPGEKLDYLLSFRNIGNETLDPVVIGDRLPAGITYVPGSLEWLSYHTGWKWQKADSENLFVGGANIFGYDGYTVDSLGNRVYAEAYLRFVGEVAPLSELACGRNVLTNLGFAKPHGYGTTQSSADVIVNKECEVVVEKKCEGLSVVKLNRTSFDFRATARVQNATVVSYVFTTRNSSNQVVKTETVTTSALNANYSFSSNTPGEYTTNVVVNTDKGVADGTCVTKVKVEEEPAAPVYACDDVKIEKLGGRKIKATVVTSSSPANRVSLKNIEYNYGDGSTPLVTDKTSTEYTYVQDGTYKVAVKVTFTVDGVDQTVVSEKCAEVVTFTSEEKCPHNPNLPKNDANCKPTTIPNTGAGSTAGIFLLSSVLGMALFRTVATRKQ